MESTTWKIAYSGIISSQYDSRVVIYDCKMFIRLATGHTSTFYSNIFPRHRHRQRSSDAKVAQKPTLKNVEERRKSGAT